MNKQILLILILLSFIQISQQEYATYAACLQSEGCDTSASTNQCGTDYSEFNMTFFTFEYQDCTDYMFDIVDDQSRNTLDTAYIACLDAFNADYASTFLQCMIDGFTADPSDITHFDATELGLTADTLCLASCLIPNNCMENSDCATQFQSGVMADLIFDNNLDGCVKMFSNGQLSTTALSTADYVIQEYQCYDDLSTSTTVTELSNAYSCISGCIQDYNIDFRTYHEEPTDKVEICQQKCFDACPDFSCFTTQIDYIDFLQGQDNCQQWMKQTESDDGTQATAKITDDCFTSLISYYSSDSGVKTLLQCQIDCAYGQETSSSQILLFFLEAIVFIALIF